MEDNIYLCSLFDYYGELLTERQVNYFRDYYFDNLSLSEISENNKVSRNAVHKTLSDAKDKLLYYEKKLMLYEKGKKIKQIIGNLDKNLQEEINKLT